ncbi:MAG: flagellar biosynthetic protein FliO [Fibrobacterota bacterium]|nr:flagellar biosynthetic protein FliO [Fibrobacterota bacterium]
MNPFPLRLRKPIAALAIVFLAIQAVGIAKAETGKSLYAAAEPRTAELPPSPPTPTPAMEDKFRKLQKEMDRREPTPKKGEAAKTEQPLDQTVSLGKLAMQILFGLAFVLLLAVVSIRGLKRIQGRLLSKPGRGGGDLFEVLETCHLGSRQRVVALRMNQEVGILGVTEHGISLLTVLKEPVEELRRARSGESNSVAFSDNLNKLLERFKKPKKVSDMLDEEAR